MQPQNSPEISDFYNVLSGNPPIDLGAYTLPSIQSYCSFSGNPWDESIITDTPQTRALAASHNHKEAEKRRRERINSHLHTLRTLLPCNPKTDKASLLAKVVQRVKELKKETSEITQLETVPSETDEITVFSNNSFSGNGKIIIKATLCCEDRSDLIPDLIEMLKSLKLSPLRVEMVAFGGRIRNMMIVEGDKDRSSKEMVQFLNEALRSLVQRSSLSSKRQHVFDRRIK